MTNLCQTVEKALVLWGLEGADFTLVAARENRVFRVHHRGECHALRLHRPDYRGDAELHSELEWLEAVGRGGLSVPRPMASASGALLLKVDGFQVDLLSWLDGQPMGATGVPLALADRQGTFRRIGQEMACLHEVSDAWTRLNGVTRMAWDRDGLLGEAPLWGRFWENPALSAGERDMLLAFRSSADAALRAREHLFDYGLIHADLVRENIMIDGDRVQLIDFDDGGFGFRLFDVATALGKNLDEPDYGNLKLALLEGYRSVRPLDTAALDLFLALRAATYVGWIVPRMNEAGAAARNTRFVRTAVELAGAWLSAKTAA